MATDDLDKFIPDNLSDEGLDHVPLEFGMYRGQTPEKVSESKRGREWLCWAYESTNRPVCSYALYKDNGGKGAKKSYAPKTPTTYRSPPAREYKSPSDNHNYTPFKPTGFDDMDDDIPF